MDPSGIAESTKGCMSFPVAIQAVIDDRRIARLEWKDPQCYAELRNGFLMIHLADGWHTWTVNHGDLVATDWVILTMM